MVIERNDMRVIFHVQCTLILVLTPLLSLYSQVLPKDVKSWQLVKTFIQETGSPEKDVDRSAFKNRLTGEAAELDIEEMRGQWPNYIDVYIDTIIALPERYREIPGNKEEGIPDRTDTILRSTLGITTYINGTYESYSFFCEHDSIWRIESWRQFPTLQERQAITKTIVQLDTSSPDYLQQRSMLTTLLVEEKSQSELFLWIGTDATEIARQLLRSTAWKEFSLASLELDSIGEYDVFDDDLSPSEQLLHRLNLSAIKRLSTQGISKIIRYQHLNENVYSLFELGSFEGKSVGFLFALDSIPPPITSKDGFFTMKSLDSGWWFYKGALSLSSKSTEKSPKELSLKEEAKSRIQTRRSRSTPTSKGDKSQFLVPKDEEH